MKQESRRFALLIICYWNFGKEFYLKYCNDDELFDKLLASIGVILEILQFRLFMPIEYWKYIKTQQTVIWDLNYNIILDFIKKGINLCSSQPNQQNQTIHQSEDIPILVQQLMQLGQFQEKEIFDEALTFFFAGHETTAHLMGWLWLLLANNPDKLEKLRNEIKEKVGNSELSYEIILGMPYLDAVIKEALRMFPTTPFTTRNLKRDEIIEGIKIPKGSTLLLSIYSMHYAPQYWKNPERFEPERFSDSERQTGAYLPFSGGQRICVGKDLAYLESKTILVEILRNFNYEVIKGDLIPDQSQVSLQTKELLCRFTKINCN